jgi:glutamate-1-semialdehyde 2,1-aminomutase
MNAATHDTAADFLARAARIIPGGVNSCRRRTEPPLAVKSARGAYIFDRDDKRYIDYHAAYGAIVLGHCDERVRERIHGALATYDLVGTGVTDLEVELAQKIVDHVPSADEVLLCGSGSEATYHAVRVARAVTGNRKIIKFQGCYHGFHDYVLPNAMTDPGAPRKADPDASAGGLASALAETLVARYNDLDSVDALLADPENDVAGIIVEPIAHNPPSLIPLPGFLEELRERCDAHGVVLIFDEVITGFRHGLGGYQEICGVTPDVTTFAKAMGNGLPVAAIVGRRHIMERFNTRSEGDVFYSGTYNGNAASVAAALATIEALEDGEIHQRIYALGERMRQGLRSIADELAIPAVVSGYGSLYVLLFMDGPLVSNDDVLRNDATLWLAYKHEMLARGILEMPAINALRSHVSAAHSAEDIDLTLEAARDSLIALTRDGRR